MKRPLSLVLITCLVATPIGGCATGAQRVPTISSAGARKDGSWSRVLALRPGSTIKLTLTGGRPAIREFVGADDSAVVVINLTDTTLPRQVTRTLRTLASERPADMVKVSHGETLNEGPLRLGPDGVFLDGRWVTALDRVVMAVARERVAEVGLVHRAIGRTIGWGALIGGAIGLAVTLGRCGTNWSQETSACSNLTPALVFIGPLFGTLIGGAAGIGLRFSTVVYRA